ncbi:hypothetical protein GRW79_22390 [Escherichia coli]|nr:hypothetical protein [Escherichia coli]MXH05221.1 hypothetical protein [Escherichia coli]
MKKNTRFAFNAYLQQLARLNGVAVEELSSKFTVEPSVQQTLEDQIQQASLQKYIASQTRLGRDIRRSAIFAALHVEGVQRVELASPLADVVLNKTQAASCTQWSVTNGGTDE